LGLGFGGSIGVRHAELDADGRCRGAATLISLNHSVRTRSCRIEMTCEPSQREQR
jgi:hypothetical protein